MRTIDRKGLHLFLFFFFNRSDMETDDGLYDVEYHGRIQIEPQETK